LLTLLSVLLSASSSEEFIQNGPATYSVSAQYGSSMGGWDRAKEEATAKATQFCQRSGQQLALRDEQRSDSSFPGGAPEVNDHVRMCSGYEQYRGSSRRNAATYNRWRTEEKPAGRLLRRRQDDPQREAHGGYQKMH
jgi:hypothetical protein